MLSLQVEHDVVALGSHPVGLDALAGVVEGAAGADVELPLVPWAGDDLTGPLVDVAVAAADLLGADVSAQRPAAERCALVRADVAQGEELAADVEDADAGRAAERHDPPAAGRE